MKFKNVIIIILVIISLVLFSTYIISNRNKGGYGTGMFEKNSEKITVYVDGSLIMDISGVEQERLVSILKNTNLETFTTEPFDESYTIVIDCNNDWGKVYMRSSDGSFYLANKEHRYRFSQEDYDYIMLNYVNP